MTSRQQVEKSKKSNAFSNINQFELQARGRKVEKAKNPIYSVKTLSLTSQQEVEKSKSRKNTILFCNFDHFDLPSRGWKVEKSKNSNRFSKINHFDLPARGQKVEKPKKNQPIQ